MCLDNENYYQLCLKLVLIAIDSHYHMNILFFLYNNINIIYLVGIKFKKVDMSSIKICLNCGSSDLVSDRSLGGKMVCFKCGSSSFRNKSFFQIKNKKVFYLVISLIILLIIII